MKKFFFFSKNRKFNTILELAEKLEQELKWVLDCNNAMDRIVEFFRITSPIQDEFLSLYKDKEGKLFNKIKDLKKSFFLKEFEKFLENVGRDPYGWNRTKIGEVPHSLNVFIQVRGHFNEMLHTRTVFDHLSRRMNPKGEVDYILNEEDKGKFNETEVVEESFVRPFMESNYNFLRKILKDLKAQSS